MSTENTTTETKVEPIVITAQIFTQKQPLRKVKILSNTTIRLNGRMLAHRVLAGKYNSQQALEEFKKNPHLFKAQAGFGQGEVEQFARLAA